MGAVIAVLLGAFLLALSVAIVLALTLLGFILSLLVTVVETGDERFKENSSHV